MRAHRVLPSSAPHLAPRPPPPAPARPRAVGKLGQSLPAEALPPFLRAVEAACRRMLPLELSPTLLGLAYMGCSPGLAAPTAEALLHEAARRAQQFGPQELANLAHGFSRVGAGWALFLHSLVAQHTCSHFHHAVCFSSTRFCYSSCWARWKEEGSWRQGSAAARARPLQVQAEPPAPE